MIWVRKDLPSLIRWAESLDTGKDPLALTTRAFLMSRVDARTRKRWLADAKTRDPDHEKIGILLEGWVGWDPKNALEAALATKDLEIIEEISIQASSGPFMPWLRNTVHANLGFMQHFDPARLPRAMQKDHFINWEEILETWGEVDIGETARYGVDFILHHNYASRERLLRFFSGDDEYPDTGDVIDRTFCALRVWAVARPEEMKAWIATLKDKDLRKALTWLRENPWGTETTP